MSPIQKTFKRTEMKYRINAQQQEELIKVLSPFVHKDERGCTTICNLYFDTPDMLLIRRSIEKPVYKEKLRLRSYGRVNPQDTVFVELKKKYKKVVYKRRVPMTEEEAMQYLSQGVVPENHTQILREIDYFCSLYQELAPRMLIAYERMAYYGNEDSELRITFDRNILWRTEDLSLTLPMKGNLLLPEDEMIMEIKIAGAIPLWLSHILCAQEIYKTSFSKYGTAYKTMLDQEQRRSSCA